MSSLADKARDWMVRNPDAMALFEQLALKAGFRGRMFGFKAIAEVIRWEFFIGHDEREDFKISNSHIAYIAREVIARHPWLEQFIVLRTTEASDETID
jgi:hypothetical protein